MAQTSPSHQTRTHLFKTPPTPKSNPPPSSSPPFPPNPNKIFPIPKFQTLIPKSGPPQNPKFPQFTHKDPILTRVFFLLQVFMDPPQSHGGAVPPPAIGAPYAAFQHMYQQQQQQQNQQLQLFWADQYREIENTTDFKNHNLPLARIKKIMKADEDVRMIAAEAPVVFARACEMFILELTHRGWAHAEENKRRTLQKNDIAAAITRTDVFDFLVDIVPREDGKEEGMARAAAALGAPGAVAGDPMAYYYVPQ